MGKRGPQKGEGRGRERIEDKRKDFWKQFSTLCRIQCTQEEIAAVLDTTVDTLNAACRRVHNKTFSEFYEQFKLDGRSSLRHAMFNSALKGEPSIQKHLSKNYLGMVDKKELDLGNPDGKLSPPPIINITFTKKPGA